MSRLLVAADLHLEKGMDYSADRLGEQEAVWAKIVQLAGKHKADALLFAGDATEYRAPSSAARAAFQRPLVGLDIPVLAIPGNHDVKHPRYPTALALMAPGLGGDLLNESHAPELRHVGGVTVATLPWTPMGTFIAQRNGRPSFEEAAAELVAIAEGLCAEARSSYPDRPVVLLGHWALDRSVTPTGKSAAEFHEPVLPVDELMRCDYDAAAFGHVHNPQVFESIVVPGSPLPLDFGEAGVFHGCWLLEVETGGCEWTFLPIGSRRFVTLDLDADEAVCLADGLTHFGYDEVADAVVRVRYTATEEQAAQINVAKLRRVILEAGAHRVWQVSPTIERSARPRAEGIASLTPMQAVDLWLASREEAPAGVRDVAQKIIEEVAP